MFTKEAIRKCLSRNRLVKVAASAAMNMKPINPSTSPRPPADKATMSMPSVPRALNSEPSNLENLSGQKINPSVKTKERSLTFSTRVPGIPAIK